MPRRPATLLLRALALVLAVALLAGCRLDVGVDVTMRADGSGSVVVTAAADADLLAKAPGALGDLQLDDVRAAGWTVEGPAPVDGGGQRLTLTKPFVSPEHAASVLGELSGPGGPLRGLQLSTDRTFGTLRTGLTGSVGLDGGLAALGDADLVAALGRVGLSDRVTGDVGEGLAVTVTAHLPGRVEDTDGTAGADGTSVSWTPDLRSGRVTELRAAFVERDDDAIAARSRADWARTGLIVWAVVVVVALLAVAVLVATRRRRSGSRFG